MNSRSGISREPPRCCNRTRAFRTSSAGTPSAAGDALQRLPATVPRFWIWRPPTSWAASRTQSNHAGRSESIASVHVTSAPSSTRSGKRRIPASVSMPVMSRTGGLSGWSRPRRPQPTAAASAGYTSVPPARIRCGRPLRRRSASRRLCGRAYAVIVFVLRASGSRAGRRSGMTGILTRISHLSIGRGRVRARRSSLQCFTESRRAGHDRDNGRARHAARISPGTACRSNRDDDAS